MFEGEREKVTVKLTTLARTKVRQTQETLERKHGIIATEAAAVEYLIRRATRTPLDQGGGAFAEKRAED